MKYRTFLTCLAMLLPISGSCVAADAAPRILMLTQSKGFTHGSVRRPADQLAPAEIAVTQLAQQSKAFTVVCTQDAAADFTKENLQNYDIVAFYTTGNLPIAQEDLDYFFQEWLTAKGHGFIGFHSASDTFHDYEPYWDMVGGTFNGHPWSAAGEVTVTVHDPEFPAMQPFGSEWTKKDEIYQYKNWQPEKVHVLMSLNMEKCAVKKPYHVPVAWCKNYGEGKMFYTNFGHREDTWTNRQFLDSIVGAVNWIAGKAEGNATPNPKLSAEEEAKAKLAAEATN